MGNRRGYRMGYIRCYIRGYRGCYIRGYRKGYRRGYYSVVFIFFTQHSVFNKKLNSNLRIS